MVTLQNAEQALKTVYLGVISDQLNTTVNPLFSMIKQSTKDVWGKEVRKLVRYGITCGIGAGDEDGDLPTPGGNDYLQLTATLKNLYGQISISDKAIRASASSEGAFVNLLNDEMDGLLKASRLNLGRMLFGDGSGVIGTVFVNMGPSMNLQVVGGARFIPGMKVNLCSPAGVIKEEGLRVNRVAYGTTNPTVQFDRMINTYAANDVLILPGSGNKEITGLKSIMDSTGELYGIDKSTSGWFKSYGMTSLDGTLNEMSIQKLLDILEDNMGSRINVLVSGAGVRRNYMNQMLTYRRNIDVMSFETGYKTISFNGIPYISDRFCENRVMYALNTDDFCLHQLCDWKWLENENGKILHKNQGKATFNATLVKYAELICDRPNGQGKIMELDEA